MGLDVEERDDIGMRRKFDDGVDRQGAVAGAQQNDGKRGAVSEGQEVGEDFSPAVSGLRTIDPERSEDAGLANNDGVVAEAGGGVGEVESGGDAVAGDAGDENLFGSGGFGGGAEDFAGFVVGEECGFAGGAEDDEAGGGGLGIAGMFAASLRGLRRPSGWKGVVSGMWRPSRSIVVSCWLLVVSS